MIYRILCIGLWLFNQSCDTTNSDKPSITNTILALERKGIEQEFINDTSFLSSIMDTTFIELSGDSIKNKHEVLKTIYANNLENKNQQITLDSFVLEHPIIHSYGNTAIATFILHTYRKKAGIPYERKTRFYDVWVQRNQNWKAVSWQATPIE